MVLSLDLKTELIQENQTLRILKDLSPLANEWSENHPEMSKSGSALLITWLDPWIGWIINLTPHEHLQH